MKPSETLNKAADWLETNDWCQGHEVDTGVEDFEFRDWDEGRHGPAQACCAWGVIQLVAPDRSSRVGAIWALNRILGYEHLTETDLIGPEFTTEWNDAQGRKKTEVVSTLRRAADLAKTEEEKK